MTTAVGLNSAGGGGGGGAGAPSSFAHAKLLILDPPPDGKTDKPGPKIGEIEFQFNPKELSLTKTANWQKNDARNKKKSGPSEFKGAQPAKLALEMFLDATEKMDDSVVKKVEQLFQCCVPTDKSLGQSKASPPWVQFQWGGMLSFPGHINTVTAKYTLFSSSGTPIRALCTLSIEEISGDKEGQNPTSGALAARDVHTTTDGDTLASVAYQAWGNPQLWRDLAEANGIDNPMALRPGTRLLVPALEELPSLGKPGGNSGGNSGGSDGGGSGR